MDLEPKSENGKHLNLLLQDWKQSSPQEAAVKLKRVFLMYASKIVNENSFIAALYGQGIGDETPLALMEKYTTDLLRVQFVLELSLGKGCIKEIVVALEWSENKKILEELLIWAQNTVPKENTAQECNQDPFPSVNPRHSDITLNFLSSQGIKATPPAAFKPRERTIDLEATQESIIVVEVCGNKIIVGGNRGRIRIFNGLTLQLEKTLTYFDSSCVCCLQCTCTEIIASYGSGCLYVWNIESGALDSKLDFPEMADSKLDFPEMAEAGCAISMRWRKPKLVVGFSEGTIGIWHYENSSFVLSQRWRYLGSVDYPQRVDCYGDYFVVKDAARGEGVKVFKSSSQPNVYRVIYNLDIYHTSSECDMTMYNKYVITGHEDGVLRIWDVTTGGLLKELEGHHSAIISVGAESNCIVSGDRSGEIIIRSLEGVLEDNPKALIFRSKHTEGLDQFRDCETYPLCLGRNIFASRRGTHKIAVTDFVWTVEEARD